MRQSYLPRGSKFLLRDSHTAKKLILGKTHYSATIYLYTITPFCSLLICDLPSISSDGLCKLSLTLY